MRLTFEMCLPYEIHGIDVVQGPKNAAEDDLTSGDQFFRGKLGQRLVQAVICPRFVARERFQVSKRRHELAPNLFTILHADRPVATRCGHLEKDCFGKGDATHRRQVKGSGRFPQSSLSGQRLGMTGG